MRHQGPRVVLLAAASLVVVVLVVTACSRSTMNVEPPAATADLATRDAPTPSPAADAVQQARRADDELRAAFDRLLTRRSIVVNSYFYKTTYLTARQEGVDVPVRFVFGHGPVRSSGRFRGPGSFELRQWVDPPIVSTRPGVRLIRVEGTEWFVSVKDGAVVSAASTGLASVFPRDPSAADLIAQFLSISLTGGAFDGGLDDFLAFDSLEIVPRVWDEVGAAKIIEGRRVAITGGVEVWRFALDRDGRLKRISFATEPPPVTVVSGSLQPVPYRRPVVLTFAAPPIDEPRLEVW